ncbi:hypothetical protein TNCV_4941051 [Trichonephila clavipes]|nr:hypothetical protein TNCV_4941051 [Trichonephila clavipes]
MSHWMMHGKLVVAENPHIGIIMKYEEGTISGQQTTPPAILHLLVVKGISKSNIHYCLAVALGNVGLRQMLKRVGTDKMI